MISVEGERLFSLFSLVLGRIQERVDGYIVTVPDQRVLPWERFVGVICGITERISPGTQCSNIVLERRRCMESDMRL